MLPLDLWLFVSLCVRARAYARAPNEPSYYYCLVAEHHRTMVNESAPIQLAQCRFPGLAISDAKILIYIFKQNIRKQFYHAALGN